MMMIVEVVGVLVVCLAYLFIFSHHVALSVSLACVCDGVRPAIYLSAVCVCRCCRGVVRCITRMIHILLRGGGGRDFI